MWKGLVAAAMLMVGAGNASAAVVNLVTNGGFESGLSGWSCVNANLCFGQAGAGLGGSSGFVGYDNFGTATLSQSFATVVGVKYNFSFWSKAWATPANVLKYSLNGASPVSVQPVGTFQQTLGSFTANSNSTTLSFLFSTDPDSAIWSIDEVSVTAVPTVPLPASAWMLLAALGGIGAVARRKQRMAA